MIYALALFGGLQVVLFFLRWLDRGRVARLYGSM